MMRALPRHPAWYGGALLLAIFNLSCRIAPIRADRAPTPAGTRATVAQEALSGTRTALARQFETTADVYFHKGVPPHRETAFENSLYQRMAAAVSPHAHVHVHGDELNEIMPWLWFAIRTDPRNLESYLIAAYWLQTNSKRPDLAHKVLHRGMVIMPRAYALYLDDARVYIEEGRLEAAMRQLEAALRFWPGGGEDTDEQARIDKASILLHKALLHEVRNEREQAIQDLRGVLEVYPDDLSVRRRVDAIASGAPPSERAKDLLARLLTHHEAAHFACEHAGPDHVHEPEAPHTDGHEH